VNEGGQGCPPDVDEWRVVYPMSEFNQRADDSLGQPIPNNYVRELSGLLHENNCCGAPMAKGLPAQRIFLSQADGVIFFSVSLFLMNCLASCPGIVAQGVVA